MEGFEKECKELSERLKDASVKHQEALKNKSKELFEIEIRLKEEISQLNEAKEQFQQNNQHFLKRKIKSTMISIIKEVHTVYSEVKKFEKKMSY